VKEKRKRPLVHLLEEAYSLGRTQGSYRTGPSNERRQNQRDSSGKPGTSDRRYRKLGGMGGRELFY